MNVYSSKHLTLSSYCSLAWVSEGQMNSMLTHFGWRRRERTACSLLCAPLRRWCERTSQKGEGEGVAVRGTQLQRGRWQWAEGAQGHVSYGRHVWSRPCTPRIKGRRSYDSGQRGGMKRVKSHAAPDCTPQTRTGNSSVTACASVWLGRGHERNDWGTIVIPHHLSLFFRKDTSVHRQWQSIISQSVAIQRTNFKHTSNNSASSASLIGAILTL